jgi:hypothetical protein
VGLQAADLAVEAARLADAVLALGQVGKLQVELPVDLLGQQVEARQRVLLGRLERAPLLGPELAVEVLYFT